MVIQTISNVADLGQARRRPDECAGAVLAAWCGGHVKGLRFGGVIGVEAMALEGRP